MVSFALGDQLGWIIIIWFLWDHEDWDEVDDGEAEELGLQRLRVGLGQGQGGGAVGQVRGAVHIGTAEHQAQSLQNITALHVDAQRLDGGQHTKPTHIYSHHGQREGTLGQRASMIYSTGSKYWVGTRLWVANIIFLEL